MFNNDKHALELGSSEFFSYVNLGQQHKMLNMSINWLDGIGIKLLYFPINYEEFL